MVWFKVDDSLHSHPKAMVTSLAALGLWTVAGSWSGDHLTDGFVPDQAVNMLSRGASELAEELVAAGLWKRTRGGYRFHQWDANSDGAKRNPTRAEIEADRKAAKERMARIRAGHNGNRSDGVRANNGRSSGEVRDPRPDPTIERSKERSGPRERDQTKGTRIPEDFAVSEAMVAWARENCPDVDGKRETEKFINYWSAKTGKDATKRDWTATWRNWMLNAEERAAPARPKRTIDPDRAWMADLS